MTVRFVLQTPGLCLGSAGYSPVRSSAVGYAHPPSCCRQVTTRFLHYRAPTWLRLRRALRCASPQRLPASCWGYTLPFAVIRGSPAAFPPLRVYGRFFVSSSPLRCPVLPFVLRSVLPDAFLPLTAPSDVLCSHILRHRFCLRATDVYRLLGSSAVCWFCIHFIVAPADALAAGLRDVLRGSIGTAVTAVTVSAHSPPCLPATRSCTAGCLRLTTC